MPECGPGAALPVTSHVPRWLPRWLRRRLEVNLWHQQEMLAAAGAAMPPGARVLDAGAGEGRFKAYFEHARYTAVDMAVGDRAWDYSGLDALGDLSRLPFADGVFDAAVCTMVLEHVREPRAVLGEIARVLQPGGALYASVPQSFHQHQQPHDYYRYTSFGLRYLLEGAGLTVVRLEPMGGYFWFLSFQLQALVSLILPRPRGARRPWWHYPLMVLLQPVFFVALPLLLFYLDPLDRRRDATLGWVVEARKR